MIYNRLSTYHQHVDNMQIQRFYLFKIVLEEKITLKSNIFSLNFFITLDTIISLIKELSNMRKSKTSLQLDDKYKYQI